MAKKNKKK